MRFEFATANQILFGPGAVEEVPARARSFGQRALVITPQDPAITASLLDALQRAGLELETFTVSGEPTINLVQDGVGRARQQASDLVIGAGGGSVLDTGKAVAALLANGGELLDYLEVIGQGRPLTEPSAPYIAVPTTAGTGAEVTRNAVLASPENQVKVSMRSPGMLPSLAVVDPELTYSMSPALTASTGLDALTQLMEPFVSNQANPLTDALCREGLRRAGRSLRKAFETGDPAAREDMALASLFGGLALANAKLGAVHGFAGPLGGMYPAPHGVICARLLPFVMAANVQALAEREPEAPALTRYREIAQILTGDPQSGADQGVAWIQALCAALRVPPLSSFGVLAADLPEIVEKSQQASSMKGNPIQLTGQELTAILSQAL